MKTIHAKLVALLALPLSLLLAMSVAFAQDDFPSGEITLIIPYGPGGMTDVSGRILAEFLERELGQRVDVVNRPGAGGFVGLGEFLRTEPDGHTIIAVTTDIVANSVLLERDFDLDSLAFVGSYMPQERVLFANLNTPYETFEGFLEHAQQDRVTFADGGALWLANIMRAMAQEAGADISHVPFESGAEGSAALLGGHVDIGETGVGTPAWHAAKEGELRILGVLTDGDLTPFGFDEVENLQDKGFTFVARMYYGLALPAGVPEERRARLEAALQAALEDEDVVRRLEEIDLTPRFLTGEEYTAVAAAVLEESAELKAFLDE